MMNLYAVVLIDVAVKLSDAGVEAPKFASIFKSTTEFNTTFPRAVSVIE